MGGMLCHCPFRKKLHREAIGIIIIFKGWSRGHGSWEFLSTTRKLREQQTMVDFIDIKSKRLEEKRLSCNKRLKYISERQRDPIRWYDYKGIINNIYIIKGKENPTKREPCGHWISWCFLIKRKKKVGMKKRKRRKALDSAFLKGLSDHFHCMLYGTCECSI